MPELVFFRRGEEVLRFALGEDRIVLGRSERCDVSLPDPEISRQHVALLLENGRCLLQDLSGKGTLISGEKRTSGELPDGGDIALGQWRAIYRAGSGSDAAHATELGERTELIKPADDVEATRIPAQVRIRQGGQEHSVRVPGDVFTIGKDSGNDVVLDHRFVSSRHLKVTRRDNRFLVSDQHSTNGTWLGGVRVFEAELPFLTTLRMGEAELCFEPLVTGERPVGNYFGLIGNDPSIKQLAELIDRVAPSCAAIAILGESGTGKELVARAIHQGSTRATSPLIPVNCAAISKELIESELFGHEKGAFTGAANARKGAFEEADGGTIFLDEIGELPLDLQAKLLRALESGEIKRVGASRPIQVDVRIVAATNRDLLAMSKEGRFREDLYYRLCVVPLHLSPLRNRKGDIVPLAHHFVRSFSPRGQTIRLLDGALDALKEHTWPGNVRELRNVIHRALLLRKGPNIDASDLTFDTRVDKSTGLEMYEPVPGLTLEQMLQRAERQIVEAALRRFNNNRERVARELGVARSTLFKRLKEWGLTQSED